MDTGKILNAYRNVSHQRIYQTAIKKKYKLFESLAMIIMSRSSEPELSDSRHPEFIQYKSMVIARIMMEFSHILVMEFDASISKSGLNRLLFNYDENNMIYESIVRAYFLVENRFVQEGATKHVI